MSKLFIYKRKLVKFKKSKNSAVVYIPLAGALAVKTSTTNDKPDRNYGT